jgi:tripartite-type tricarboxylate transporter receptor subunit TctC
VVPQAVVVDNKPGAGGTVAASALATSPPDGSVVYMADSAILVAPAVYEKLGYDPRALTPVLGVGQLGYCMVVNPGSLKSEVQHPASGKVHRCIPVRHTDSFSLRSA